MTQFEKLDLLLRECGGTIQTFQVLNNGISKSVFYAYVKERGLEQASHGVYVSPDTWTDAMFLLHLRCGQAVFSHETALFFHDLTDREPLKYTITVRTGYNPSRLQEDGFQVYTVKKDLHEIGIIAMQTSFGHSVPVYGFLHIFVCRGICCIREVMNHVCMDHITDQSDAALSLILQCYNGITKKRPVQHPPVSFAGSYVFYILIFCVILRYFRCSGCYFLLLYVGRCLLVAGKFIGIIPSASGHGTQICAITE